MPPIQRLMYAYPAFNARPNGAKAPSPGQASTASVTPGFARKPVRYAPTGQKQRQERSNPAHENIRHVAPHPAPRPTPIINLARTRVYIYVKQILKKCFNPSAIIQNPLKIKEKQAEGFDFQTFQHCSAINASPQPQGLKKIVPRLKNQSAELKNRKAGPKEGHPSRGGDKRGTSHTPAR